jgi:hypothetical protein
MNDANYDKWRESDGSLINPDEREEQGDKTVSCCGCGTEITVAIILAGQYKIDGTLGFDIWFCDQCRDPGL